MDREGWTTGTGQQTLAAVSSLARHNHLPLRTADVRLGQEIPLSHINGRTAGVVQVTNPSETLPNGHLRETIQVINSDIAGHQTPENFARLVAATLSAHRHNSQARRQRPFAGENLGEQARRALEQRSLVGDK